MLPPVIWLSLLPLWGSTTALVELDWKSGGLSLLSGLLQNAESQQARERLPLLQMGKNFSL